MEENEKPTIAECCELRECCPCCPNGYCQDDETTVAQCHAMQNDTTEDCCICCQQVA